MRSRASCLAFGLATAALLLPGAGPARPLPGDVEIYVIGVDGADRRNLSGNLRLPDDAPVVSPDGARIAFVRGTRPETDIWVMNADGSGQTQRAGGAEEEVDPVWAPDSKTLAFTYITSRVPAIRVLTETGGGPRRANAQRARFAPTGQLVAFEDLTPGRRAIAAMRRNGTAYRALLRAVAASPVWSPAGKRIAYERTVGGRTYVAVMNTDGTKRRRLALGADPAWSARGLIAFFRAGDIFVIQPNGRGLRRLTVGAAVDSMPAWSRDGRRLAFVRKNGNVQAQMYVVNATGGASAPVTQEPAGVTLSRPAWSRDGRQLYYAARIGKVQPPPPPPRS